MPSGHPTVQVEAQQQELSQVKLCTACRCALVDNSTTTSLYLPHLDAAICIGCRQHVQSSRNTLLLCIDVDPAFIPPVSLLGGSPRHTPEIPAYEEEMITDEPAEPEYTYHGPISPSVTYPDTPSIIYSPLLPVFHDSNQPHSHPQSLYFTISLSLCLYFYFTLFHPLFVGVLSRYG